MAISERSLRDCQLTAGSAIACMHIFNPHVPITYQRFDKSGPSLHSFGDSPVIDHSNFSADTIRAPRANFYQEVNMHLHYRQISVSFENCSPILIPPVYSPILHI